MDVGQPTLDQLRIFLAVVDEGSFSRAARKLGRAISVISYAIANLEAQLDLVLFERGGARQPVLTEHGRAVLAEVRTTLVEADGITAKVRGLKQGLEAELALAIDVMFPVQVLAEILEAFDARFPTVTLRLHIEGLGAVGALLIAGQASIGVGGPLIDELPGFRRRHIGHVRLLPVAAPRHPLAAPGQRTAGESRRHLQLVLSDRSSLTQGRDFAVESVRTWRLADLGAKLALLRAGLGWGNMPLAMVEEDLANGRLVALDLPDFVPLDYGMSAFWQATHPPGPAGQWIIDAIEERMRR